MGVYSATYDLDAKLLEYHVLDEYKLETSVHM